MKHVATDDPDGGVRRRRANVLWFAGSALLPLVAAMIIVLKPTISALLVAEGDSTGTVVLEALHEPLPDSLQAELERIRQLKDVFRSEEAFLLAQDAEATYPRSALWLNFRDSTATLSIQGVSVRTGTIQRIQMSAVFGRRTQSPTTSDDLENTFKLVSLEASIPRIPMRHVKAPKDTTEARLVPPNAFVAVEENVRATLRFDRNLVLYLSPTMGEDQWLDAMKLSLEARRDEAFRTLERFFGADSTPPERWIRLRMPSNDIRAIYRALPDDARMAIKW